MSTSIALISMIKRHSGVLLSGDVKEWSSFCWDGKMWTIVSTPNRKGSTDSGLEAVASVAPSDAWTAGVYASPSGDAVPLVEHWDGTHWTVEQRG